MLDWYFVDSITESLRPLINCCTVRLTGCQVYITVYSVCTCLWPFIIDFLYFIITNDLIISSPSDKRPSYVCVNSELWQRGAQGHSPPSPLPQHCRRSVPTVTKLSSTMVTAGLFEAISSPPPMFSSFPGSPPLSPLPLSHLLVKERVVLTSAINDHDTLTSSTTQRTHTHTCSLGNVNLQLNIISFLTRKAQKHTLLAFMLQLNV